MANKYILDASAVLASIYQEKGKDIVDALISEACISSVNATEVILNLVDKGMPHERAIEAFNLLHLEVIDFSYEYTPKAASIRAQAKKLGLSLGDICCLAMGIVLGNMVVTADKQWVNLKAGVKIKLIR